MKILLSGATSGTNFGDFLFAQIFYDIVSKMIGNENTYFCDNNFVMSEFFKKNLNYNKKCKVKEMDALIFISGGYFCGDDKGIKDYTIRFLRYFVVGLLFCFSKKPIVIIGNDIGAINNSFLLKCAKKILNSADLISVRNIESVQYLKQYHITTDYFVTSDTAQVLESGYIKDYTPPFEIRPDKKYLFFHIFTNIKKNRETVYRLIPPVLQFLEKNSEYELVVGCDQYEEFQDEVLEDIKKEINKKVILYKYEKPLELFELLNHMDYIITPKLHVGIVGCSLGKSVLSFSVHTQKIERYYKQINEVERSIPLEKCSEKTVIERLNKYKNVPVVINADIRRAAQYNLELLQQFILELEDKKCVRQ